MRAIDKFDHPKRFVSIGLWGGYVESVLNTQTGETREVRWSAPWIRTFPPEHAHSIDATERGAWTLVVVFSTKRSWGFWRSGTWCLWRRYVTDTSLHNRSCD